MNSDKLTKLGYWLLFFILFFTIGFRIIYAGTYSLINKVDPGIYFMNATNNKFNSDRFFSTEEVEDTCFWDDLINNIDGLEKAVSQSITESNNHILWSFLDQHKHEVVDIALANEKYMKYLEKKECTIEDLQEYITKMAHVDDYIIQVTIYITLVLICIITLTCFKYRKGFYCVAAIVYLIATASLFSNGLSDYLVTQVLSFVAKVNKASFSYVDMEVLKEYFLNALKEALLTVVIFDTIFELRNNKRCTQKKKDIRYTFRSIEMQMEYLSINVDADFKFVGRLRIPSVDLESQCKKEVKKMSRLLKYQKTKNSYYYSYQNQKNTNDELADLLFDLRTNNSMCLCQEYISKMNRAKELMIECKYSDV